MDTLLIVEDEAKARKELVRLVKKSSVPVDTILECSNGREAMKILQKQVVDLIFTDIRMPEMNGCELTRQVAGMELTGMKIRPKVVAISESEDFQCVVDLMKNGARDYIRKPLSFEVIDDVLERMEKELAEEKKKQQGIDWVYRQHVRHLLKNGNQDSKEAWEILVHAFEEQGLQNLSYRLILTNPSEKHFPAPYRFVLDKVNGDLYLVEEENLLQWINFHSEDFCMGISKTHTSVDEIAKAYKEALEARKHAFIMANAMEIYDEQVWEDTLDFSTEAEKYMQMFLTGKIDEARKRFQNLCFEARHQKLVSAKLVEMSEDLTQRLLCNYEHVCSRKTGKWDCPMPLDCIDVDAFMEAFDAWAAECQSTLKQHNDSSRKNEKILQALEYIHENYQRELNLAVVSNHISMNYSMFSNAFKKYTGVNFVDYLKNIRITEAKHLLEETDKKIAEIGAQVGYGNDKHFMKTFKAICGVSPSEYRRNVEITRKQGA